MDATRGAAAIGGGIATGAVAGVAAGIRAGTSLGVAGRSKSWQTSAMTAALTGRSSIAKPVTRALSQITEILRGTPPQASDTAAIASSENTCSTSPPAMRMRSAMYAAVSLRVKVESDDRNA